MKKALIVGIDNYLHVSDLTGCVNDAHDVANVLARNADGSLNFDIKVMTATSESNIVKKMNWRKQLRSCFRGTMKLYCSIFLGMATRKIIMDILFHQILNCQDAMG